MEENKAPKGIAEKAAETAPEKTGYEKRNYEAEILAIIQTSVSPRALSEQLSNYHAGDIADTVEKLDPALREKLFRILDTEELSDILEYVQQEDLSAYLKEMNVRKVISLLNAMEPDKAADVLREMDREKRDLIMELMDPDARKAVATIFAYDEDQIGSKMTTNYILVPRGLSVKQAMHQLVEQAPENDNITTLYVVDENNMYYGAVPLRDLLVSGQDKDLEDIIITSYPYLYATEPVDQVMEELKDYNEDSIPLLSNDNQLLGVITSSELLEVLDEEMGEDYAKFAGLSAEEDLKETLFQSLKKRLPWLFTLLFLGLIVSTVVSMFESVVAQLTIVMAFQSLILDMAGNVGTQSLAVTIRVLVDESLNFKQKLFLIFKEVRVGFTNGILIGVLSGIVLGIYIHFAKGFGWGDAWGIAICIGCALLVSMTISALVGTAVPLTFKRIGIDPAVASGPLITTVNDLVGVVTYYGLAWILLIQIMHL